MNVKKEYKKFFFILVLIITALLSLEANAQILDNCDAESRFYWYTINECWFFYGGSSMWADRVNNLSNNYQGYFGSIGGSEICSKLWFFSLSKRENAEGSALTLYLNIVSGRLQLKALIAGAVDEETDSFTRLGLDYTSTINETAARIEEILANVTSTDEQLDDVGNAAGRIIYFYRSENPKKPECIYKCEIHDDCDANECSRTYRDYCSDKRLVEYDNDKIKDSTPVEDSCNNTCQSDSVCSYCEPDCSAPRKNRYCVKDVCGAECSIDSDCDDGDINTEDSCLYGCTCSHLSSCVDELCNGIDDDCDGDVDEELTAPLNSKQDGVCDGSLQLCTGAGGWVDDYSRIADYEEPEASCDGMDNDCDGEVENGFPDYDNDKLGCDYDEQPLNCGADCIDEDDDNDGHPDDEDDYPFDDERWLLGDVNGDDEVNILDLIVARNAMGASPGDDNWDEEIDVNGDEVINILDLIIIRNNIT